ncbi:MAG: hypothetical protein ACAI34_02820 [Verrucomicrobium sp.]
MTCFARAYSCQALAMAVLFTCIASLPLSGQGQDQDESPSPVVPEQLTELIKQADRLVVSTGPLDKAKVLFTSTDPKDIAEFNDAVTVLPSKGYFHCRCLGTPAVRLYRGQTELVLITNHHGSSVRCELWASDASLKDSEKWLKWFDVRKMAGPRAEVNRAATRLRQAEIDRARWQAAMPQSLRQYWEKGEMYQSEAHRSGQRFLQVIEKEHPDVHKRLLALFTWFGSGEGPWSGYAAYEGCAEAILLEHSTADLVAAAQDGNLSDAQVEGAARLFGGWDFSKLRPDDLKLLPATLKKKLLDHSLMSKDTDKLDRAKVAFGVNP